MKILKNKLGYALCMLLALVLCVGCEGEIKRGKEVLDRYQVIEIDSCEYILSKSPNADYGWVMAHKGNCKHCAKRALAN